MGDLSEEEAAEAAVNREAMYQRATQGSDLTSKAPLAQCKKASYAFCCEVGKPCDCSQPPVESNATEPELLGGTLKLTWNDCGDSSTHAKVTGLSPDTITMGQTNTVTGTGTVDEQVTGGSFAINVKAGPITQKYTGDICAAKVFKMPLGLGSVKWDGMTCPLAKGSTSVKMDIQLSAAIPTGMAKAA